ncbi:hypothetical protein [Methylocystis heyeri]|uniref:DUF2019 domain-containing protein n=1 Tax=Methylocystis heyeri TaxID=391905 RepID=A0A6B8KJ44_9HYPH|nr:hypothetical protein [Methylocystis heyeri]QGM46570.1 hypothetical protein H2LOC_013180 [Methylocystis heyeri]
MPAKKRSPFAWIIIERFRQSAKVADFGYQQEDHAMQLAGLRAVDRAAKQLDLVCGPDGRLELVPLLDDPDLSVAVFAAGYLVKRMPERALAVLNDIEQRGHVEVRMTAGSILRRYKKGELDM